MKVVTAGHFVKDRRVVPITAAWNLSE